MKKREEALNKLSRPGGDRLASGGVAVLPMPRRREEDEEEEEDEKEEYAENEESEDEEDQDSLTLRKIRTLDLSELSPSKRRQLLELLKQKDVDEDAT